uniref:RING-type domain-containing protein n=1 Tax=Angiostrongylus cantonensis TaxID=6313 RepID=A0A158PA80_ANGCA
MLKLNLEAATYRAEPTRTLGTTRRPMLARRTARQPAGVGVNIGGGGPTAQPPTVGIATGPATLGLPPWSADISDVDEMFRMVNLTRHIPTLPHMPITAEMQRVSNQLFQPVANGTGLLPTLSSLRNVVTRNSEYAQPRSSTAGRQTSVATTLPQIVRPLRVVSIYPSTDSQVGTPDELEPFEELTEDDSSDVGAFVDDVDVTQEEHEDHRSEMTMAVSDHSVASHTVCEDSAATAAPSDSEFEFTFSACEDSETSSNPGDNEGGDSLPLTENKLSPFDRPLLKRDIWRALRSELTSEEFETFTNVLRREPSRDLDENEGDPVAELAGREQEQVKTDDNREAQSWLSLVYDVPPLQSFSVGGYWNDKRFLRQRKMNRESSISSGTESILDKADIVLAMIRDIGVVPPKGREYSSHALRLDGLEDALLVASQQLQSESDIVTAISTDTTIRSPHEIQDGAPALQPASSSQVSDGESSEDDDVSEQSVRPDEVEFLASDATSRA